MIRDKNTLKNYFVFNAYPSAEQFSDLIDSFPLLNSKGNLELVLIPRFGTAAEINQLVLEPGEFAWTTDTLEFRLGDGVTPGGSQAAGNPFDQSLSTTDDVRLKSILLRNEAQSDQDTSPKILFQDRASEDTTPDYQRWIALEVINTDPGEQSEGTLVVRFVTRDKTNALKDTLLQFNANAGTVTFGVPIYGFVLAGGAPAHNTSSGVAGQVTWDANYCYICTAADTWKRIPLNADTW